MIKIALYTKDNLGGSFDPQMS